MVLMVAWMNEVGWGTFSHNVWRDICCWNLTCTTNITNNWWGHGSHISYSIIKRALEENIEIILLPPTTNVLQPLAVGLFRSLKANLSKVTNGVKMLSVTGYYQNINKTNFTAIFEEFFERWMSLATIKNGFRKTGIYPFNPEAIHKTRLIPYRTITIINTTHTKFNIARSCQNGINTHWKPWKIRARFHYYFIRKKNFGHITKYFDKNKHRVPVSSWCILPAIKWMKQKILQTMNYNRRKNNYR